MRNAIGVRVRERQAAGIFFMKKHEKNQEIEMDSELIRALGWLRHHELIAICGSDAIDSIVSSSYKTS